MSSINNNGPPSASELVKKYVGYKAVVLIFYAAMLGLMMLLSSNIGKVTYFSPPPQKHVALAYYQSHNNDPVKAGYHYRL